MEGKKTSDYKKNGVAKDMSQSTPLVSIESFILPTPNHRVKERLGGSSLNSRNISSVGLNTVDLYSGKTISYRAVKKDVDFSDYYEATSAEFQNISKEGNAYSLWSSLKQENDLHWVHSPSSDSEYLLDYKNQKVYRYSDHWGKVGSCEWALNDITTGWNVGVSFLKDFKALPSSRSEVLRSSFIEKLNQSIVNLEDIINRPDIKKTSSAEKELRNRLNSLVDYKETLTDWKVFNEKYNVDKQSKNIHDMGNKKDTSLEAANKVIIPQSIYSGQLKPLSVVQDQGGNQEKKVSVPESLQVPVWEAHEKEKSQTGDFTYQDTAEEYGNMLLKGVENILPRIKGTLTIDQWGTDVLSAKIENDPRIFETYIIPEPLKAWLEVSPKEESHSNMQGNSTGKNVDIVAAYVFSTILLQKENQEVGLSFTIDGKQWDNYNEVMQGNSDHVISDEAFAAAWALQSSMGISKHDLSKNAVAVLNDHIATTEYYGKPTLNGSKGGIELLQSGKVSADYSVKGQQVSVEASPKIEEELHTEQEKKVSVPESREIPVLEAYEVEGGRATVTEQQETSPVLSEEEEDEKYSQGMLSNFESFRNESDFTNRTVLDKGNYDAEFLYVPLFLDGKPSNLAITSDSADSILSDKVNLAVYNYGNDKNADQSINWQKWSDLSEEYNATAPKGLQCHKDGDTPQLAFFSVEAAIKFNDWVQIRLQQKEEVNVPGTNQTEDVAENVTLSEDSNPQTDVAGVAESTVAMKSKENIPNPKTPPVSQEESYTVSELENAVAYGTISKLEYIQMIPLEGMKERYNQYCSQHTIDNQKEESAIAFLDYVKYNNLSEKWWPENSQTGDVAKNIHDMGNKKDTSPKAANTSYADSVLQKFADMMIKRMSEMKDSNWTKGWMNGHSEAGLPRNALTGRLYTGFNPLMLAFHSTHEGYKTAMFLTAHQLYDMNEPLKDSTTGKIKTENLDKVMKIKPGENYFPVLYILHGYRDKKGNELSKDEYSNLDENERRDIRTFFYPKVHRLYNIDQTNMKEVNPSLYQSYVDKFNQKAPIPDEEGMYKNEALDSLIANSHKGVEKTDKSWYCPIDTSANLSSPHYNATEDHILVPHKYQYKTSKTEEGIFSDGQVFYSTVLHEMAHSTGADSLLKRDFNNKFGDPNYAKEELVAELTSALISSSMGFDKRIKERNAQYVDGWLKVLREEPSFIKTVLSDVGKASDMIQTKIDINNLSLEKQQEKENLSEKEAKDYSIVKDYVTKELHFSPEEFDRLPSAEKERISSLHASSVLSEAKALQDTYSLQHKLSGFIQKVGLSDEQLSQRAISDSFDKVRKIEESSQLTKDVARIASATIINKNANSASTVPYGEYDIPTWAISHLSSSPEEKRSPLSADQLKELEIFESQFPSKPSYDFKDSKVTFSETPAFGLPTDTIKANLYVIEIAKDKKKDYSSDHDLYEAVQHEDHDALKSAAATRGMTVSQMEQSLDNGMEERLPDQNLENQRRGLSDKDKEVKFKNEELDKASLDNSSSLEKTSAQHEKEARREEERKKKEKQETEKKDESLSKVISGAFVRASLLAVALSEAKENNGIWLNKDGKNTPSFYKKDWEVSPFNQLFMSLNSDRQGYATNFYTTFKEDKDLAIKKDSKSFPYSWTDWSMYKKKSGEQQTISQNQFEGLTPEQQQLYKKSPVNYDRKIFNLDQTVLKASSPKDYDQALKDGKSNYAEKQAISATPSVDVLLEKSKEFHKKYPDAIILYRNKDFYTVYGKDAKSVLALKDDAVRKGALGKTPTASFLNSDLEKVLPNMVRSGLRVVIFDKPNNLGSTEKSSRQILDNAQNKLRDFEKTSGVSVDVSKTQETGYNRSEDSITLNTRQQSPIVHDISSSVRESNNIYYAMALSTLHKDRLNFSSHLSMPEQESIRLEKLVATLSAGLLSMKDGHPGILPDNVSREDIASWQKDLQGEQKTVSFIERNVNNVVNVIESTLKGEKVDYAAINGKQADRPVESYNYVTELNSLVRHDTSSAVIIKDNTNSSADVIIDNKSSNINKESFRQALLGEGLKDVKFFGTSGLLGLNKPDRYFSDKTINTATLSDNKLVYQQELHPMGQQEDKDYKFKDVSLVKNDAGRWYLYIKEENKPFITIQPDKQDLSRLFGAFKSHDPQKIYETKSVLGRKYTELATQHPDLKADFLMPVARKEDLSRIERANIARDSQDNNRFLIFATIDGKGYHHDLSRDQYSRMWKVDNMQDYKKALAANIFSEVLHQSSKVEQNQQSQSEGLQKSSTEGIKETPSPPQQRTEDDSKKVVNDIPQQSMGRK